MSGVSQRRDFAPHLPEMVVTLGGLLFCGECIVMAVLTRMCSMHRCKVCILRRGDVVSVMVLLRTVRRLLLQSWKRPNRSTSRYVFCLVIVTVV